MTNIPFPNPQNADDLNDYLDALAAGTRVNPESEVEIAAQEFHQLASRAVVNPPTQPGKPLYGGESMRTATLAAPISNRTRRHMANGTKHGRSQGWLAAAIVAGLLISMIGSAWLNREPRNPNDHLTWAPGTAESLVPAHNGTPSSAHQCPVTLPNNVHAEGGLDHYAADGHTWFENGIWITIPTDGVMRMQLHQQNTDPESQYFGWAFEKLIVLRDESVRGMVEITGERLDEESAEFAFNDTANDHHYGETGFVPTILMIPDEGCWKFTATAGDASATWTLAVQYVDEYPFDWTAPITYDECPQEEVLPLYDRENPSGTQYTQEDYDQVSHNRDYSIVGPADPADAQTIVMRTRQMQACAERSQALPNFTARVEYETRTTAGRQSLEAIDVQRNEAATAIGVWYENELGLTPEEMWVYKDPADHVYDPPIALRTRSMANPAHAVLFADGRIGIISSAVTYEPITHDILPWYAPNMTIWANIDGDWMIDETLPICFGDCDQLPSNTTPGGDVPPDEQVATPES